VRRSGPAPATASRRGTYAVALMASGASRGEVLTGVHGDGEPVAIGWPGRGSERFREVPSTEVAKTSPMTDTGSMTQTPAPTSCRPGSRARTNVGTERGRGHLGSPGAPPMSRTSRAPTARVRHVVPHPGSSVLSSRWNRGRRLDHGGSGKSSGHTFVGPDHCPDPTGATNPGTASPKAAGDSRVRPAGAPLGTVDRLAPDPW
jgi:hypothetical protein